MINVLKMNTSRNDEICNDIFIDLDQGYCTSLTKNVRLSKALAKKDLSG